MVEVRKRDLIVVVEGKGIRAVLEGTAEHRRKSNWRWTTSQGDIGAMMSSLRSDSIERKAFSSLQSVTMEYWLTCFVSRTSSTSSFALPCPASASTIFTRATALSHTVHSRTLSLSCSASFLSLSAPRSPVLPRVTTSSPWNTAAEDLRLSLLRL